MDKIMSDVRVSSFLSVLKFIIFGIVVGGGFLISQMNGLMQLLGMRPMTDDFKKDEVIVLSLMGVFAVCIAIFVIVRLLTGRKELKETFAHSGMDEGRIVVDYENAWNVSRSLKKGIAILRCTFQMEAVQSMWRQIKIHIGRLCSIIRIIFLIFA